MSWTELLLGVIIGAILTIFLESFFISLWEVVISKLFGKGIIKLNNDWMTTFEEWDPSKKAIIKTKARITLRQIGSHIWGDTSTQKIRNRKWHLLEGKIYDNRFLFGKYRDSNTGLFRGCLTLEIEGNHRLDGLWIGKDDDYTKDTSKPIFVGSYVFEKK